MNGSSIRVALFSKILFKLGILQDMNLQKKSIKLIALIVKWHGIQFSISNSYHTFEFFGLILFQMNPKSFEDFVFK